MKAVKAAAFTIYFVQYVQKSNKNICSNLCILYSLEKFRKTCSKLFGGINHNM